MDVKTASDAKEQNSQIRNKLFLNIENIEIFLFILDIYFNKFILS